ncbi:hypothetical protein WG66_007746 [Moniliophthora roreri]|nr:hypothetical protein WG66_007746 [Moniliophthora roreri]
MQSLFWLTQARGDGHPVTKPLLRLAYAAYADCEEGASSRVHDAIQSFVTPTALFRIRGKDLTFDKIVELIHANRFTPSENFLSLNDPLDGWRKELLHDIAVTLALA